jgi:hypothetical protein
MMHQVAIDMHQAGNRYSSPRRSTPYIDQQHKPSRWIEMMMKHSCRMCNSDRSIVQLEQRMFQLDRQGSLVSNSNCSYSTPFQSHTARMRSGQMTIGMNPHHTADIRSGQMKADMCLEYTMSKSCYRMCQLRIGQARMIDTMIEQELIDTDQAGRRDMTIDEAASDMSQTSMRNSQSNR